MMKYLLSVVAASAIIPLSADCVDYPWQAKAQNFLTDLFVPYNCNVNPYLVVGGSANYSTSSYPQFSLYDLFEAATLDPLDFGSEEGQSYNNESFQNYFWGVYGGFHQPVNKNWALGFEVGYKKVVGTKSTANILYAAVPITAPLITPFRNIDNDVWDVLFVVKYQTQMGFNLFVKAGGAKLHTVIKEGNFINPLDISLSGLNTFGTRSYSMTNIYPEIEIGAGYRFLNHFEFHLSYAKIIAPTENDIVSSTSIFLHPRRCPSIDIFTASLEMLVF